jgi:hypothetical protein
MHKVRTQTQSRGGGGEGENTSAMNSGGEGAMDSGEEGGEGVQPQQLTRSGRYTQHTTSRERAHRAGAHFRSTDKGGSKAPWSSNGNKK